MYRNYETRGSYPETGGLCDKDLEALSRQVIENYLQRTNRNNTFLYGLFHLFIVLL